MDKIKLSLTDKASLCALLCNSPDAECPAEVIGGEDSGCPFSHVKCGAVTLEDWLKILDD